MKPEEVAKLKPGSLLFLKRGKKFRQFYWDGAWSMSCTSEGLPEESDALEYALYIMFHFCLERAVVLREHISDVGNGLPGVRADVYFPHGIKESKIIEHKFIERAEAI